jgi:F0F1-type ATP synthase assembly protein I
MAEESRKVREPAGNTALTAALRTLCRGVLHAIGMFDPAVMTEEEKAEDPAEYRTWFCLGETGMAALLAADIAVPAFFWFAGMTALPLAVIGAAVLFLPLFVFLPKIIRYAMKTDTDAVLEAFGKNEQTKKVFWALFIATAGLVLAEVLDPVTANQIVGMIPRI